MNWWMNDKLHGWMCDCINGFIKKDFQSIFDLIMKGYFKFVRLTGSVYCAVAVLAQFNEMAITLR